VLASLNHPNIAAIHGLEEAANTTALVLELVEGPTLADRIAQGPVPPDEAVPIARQIIEALEAAQQQGVVHRDLKSANIKVRDDGTVTVRDFGLAKAIEPGAGSRVSSQRTRQRSRHRPRRPAACSWARPPAGRELFFIDDEGVLTAVSVDAGTAFAFGKPRRVLNRASFNPAFGRTYDVSRDGQRFLMIKDEAAGALTPNLSTVVVVLNWFAELKARVDAGKDR
jgi:serine/threonine protein kinase